MNGGISELCNVVKRLPLMHADLFEVPDFSTKNRTHCKFLEMKRLPVGSPSSSGGAVDGTRTRDPRRDRPVL
jgi:hypothetical protein